MDHKVCADCLSGDCGANMTLHCLPLNLIVVLSTSGLLYMLFLLLHWQIWRGGDTVCILGLGIVGFNLFEAFKGRMFCQPTFIKNQEKNVTFLNVLWVTFIAEMFLHYFSHEPPSARSQNTVRVSEPQGSRRSCKYWWTMSTDKVMFIKQTGYTLIMFLQLWNWN